MSAKVNYFKLGLFVIAAVALLAAGVSILGMGSILRKKVLVETYVNESVQGLDVGSPVKYRGVRIGNVKEIAFVHNEHPELPASSPATRYVLVRCVVYPDMLGEKGTPDVRPFLYNEVQKGLRARLAMQGITGTVYLEVDYVDPEENPPLEISWEPRSIYIPSVPSLTAQVGDMAVTFLSDMGNAGIPEMLENMRTFLTDADRTVKNLDVGGVRDRAEKLLDEVRETNRKVDALLASPEVASAKTDAAATLAQTRRFVNDSSANIEKLVTELRTGAKEFNDASSRLNRFLAGSPGSAPPLDSLSHTLANLETTSAGTPETIARLNSTLRRLDQLLSAKQSAIESTLDNLDKTMKNLRDVSEDADFYPSRILLGAPPKPLEIEK